MANLPHLRISGTETSHDYTARGGGGGSEYQLPVRDRLMHATQLKNELQAAEQEARNRGLRDDDPRLLTYELRPDAMEVVESLERRQSGIELLSVVKHPTKIVASVRVPAGKQRIVEAVFHRYETKEHPRSQRPRHQNLVESIDGLRLATETDLWTDSVAFPGPDDPIWWEVWLFHDNASRVESTYDTFATLARQAGLTVNPRRVVFPDRVVILVHGTFTAWHSQPRLLLSVAELRKAKELAGEYVALSAEDQAELIAEARENIEPPPDDAPAVCVLDTGVDRVHPLLELALAAEDTQTVDPAWGIDDDNEGKHGTAMAGIALYGSLTKALMQDEAVSLSHRLESVKILPRACVGNNDPDLYGEITQQAIARAEATAPERRRIGCLAVTADSRDGGRPSSWSGAVDQLCAGGPLTGDPKLICVAAGNLRDQIVESSYRYPVLEGDLAGVEDPGQAWNALTVGAYTELVTITNEDFDGYEPIAPSGDISPTSRTSMAWPEEYRKGWPLKPDIVMEGGNWAATEGGIRDTPDNLGLLTTIVQPPFR